MESYCCVSGRSPGGARVLPGARARAPTNHHRRAALQAHSAPVPERARTVTASCRTRTAPGPLSLSSSLAGDDVWVTHACTTQQDFHAPGALTGERDGWGWGARLLVPGQRPWLLRASDKTGRYQTRCASQYPPPPALPPHNNPSIPAVSLSLIIRYGGRPGHAGAAVRAGAAVSEVAGAAERGCASCKVLNVRV